MGTTQKRKCNARIRETKSFRNRNGKGMELLTAELLRDLPTPDKVEGDDPTVYAKLFDPIGSWTCWVLAYWPKSRILYGLVDSEFGDVPPDQLIAVERMGAIGIERSTSFRRKRLSECV